LDRDNVILCGDLNSNAIWDVPDRWWNHSDVVQELNEIGLVSLYHYTTKESQGMETQMTFYMNRKKEKASLFNLPCQLSLRTLMNDFH
jgi:hypothetical protein